MSFMFHPYPYKDLHAVNPVTPRDTVVEGALPGQKFNSILLDTDYLCVIT